MFPPCSHCRGSLLHFYAQPLISASSTASSHRPRAERGTKARSPKESQQERMPSAAFLSRKNGENTTSFNGKGLRAQTPFITGLAEYGLSGPLIVLVRN
ncbi:hypothetical protein PAAG_12167 [Paracoccidioides lutzii Pb01]|uniref:Uncharacterized protein n=1 Tax=Paracoccidioides lutzii (strain ATCC MYA-826 / Pb01) TaxID=502779 RepID=A0A0A2VJT6_PARBA|nr:hypothetical protein PAAG_12167 [Paracoccidioides lutzii Pb01]KGQ01129.1 hypothetical protein PAAG_12167 [Paracoccidioides lutzii Pb01]